MKPDDPTQTSDTPQNDLEQNISPPPANGTAQGPTQGQITKIADLQRMHMD